MPFVKLDCGILNSTLWFERTAREIFITALLMAEPQETLEPLPQISTDSLKQTGWSVPPGWYGFVAAAGVGILHRAGIGNTPESRAALKSLGDPEESSRSKDFEGRRLVRVNGGYVVLNYIKYRERDYTAAERSKRYRDRMNTSRRSVTVVTNDITPEVNARRDITQAEAEAEAEAEIRRKEDLKLVTPDVVATTKKSASTKTKSTKPNGRSKHPIFQGQRFVVFDWMLEDISRILGPHYDTFGLDEWFYALDAAAVKSGTIRPKEAWWPWLQSELISEAERRGLKKTDSDERNAKEAAQDAEILRLVRESDARAAQGFK